MNLDTLVTRHVAFSQALGERCQTKQSILQAFSRTIGPRTRVQQIRRHDVSAFLAGTGPLTPAWHCRYFIVKGLFEFAVSRGYLRKAPLPTHVPKRPPALVPYVYSRAEIRRLLGAVPSCQHPQRVLEPPTLRAILLVLYGAGLRRGEALRLRVADVDLANALLTIRDTKSFKSRLVPISAGLTEVLRDYARWRAARHAGAGATGTFFLSRRGQAVHCNTLQDAFRRLREHAGVRRSDGGRFQPRMHDLRHAFAVHRLTAWYRQGADVQRLVYHLSVYLGHAHLVDTQVYLTLTPELLAEASQCFERYARGEERHA
jgi:site-specific recombinase XerD